MFQALVHGKLSREQENLEDILTSNVFGVLRYLEPMSGLVPFLRDARSPDDVPNPLLALSDPVQASLEFWPALQGRRGGFCEPDVLIRLDGASKQRWLVGVEVKYRSGKSSSGEPLDSVHLTDQLAREWDALVRVAEGERRAPMLIYLTAEFGMPRDALWESGREYQRLGGQEGAFRCFWLSWHRLPAVFAKTSAGQIGEDLLALADRLGFGYFHGFSSVPSGIQVNWFFKRVNKTLFNFSVELRKPIIWRFVKNGSK